MGFRIRKSISFGKGFRVNLGKSGITSVTFGKRGAPHITTGRRGTRFGTPVVRHQLRNKTRQAEDKTVKEGIQEIYRDSA